MAKKRYYDGSYSGPLNKARREEVQDYGMISEDKSAIANLPQSVMYKPWPTGVSYANYGNLSDTITGINDQMREDGADLRKNKGGVKY